MLPAVFFFKIDIIKKIFTFIFVLLSLFSLYIYGKSYYKSKTKIFKVIDKKYYLKVVSPNFELEYNLSREKIKKRLKKIIKYSEPQKKFKNFIRLA